MDQDLQALDNHWTQLFWYLLIGAVVAFKQLTITVQMEEEEKEETMA